MNITGKNSLFLIIISFLSPYALSEVILDGSMGAAGAIAGPDYQITQDLGKLENGNLFHSFGQFNINNTESATFSGSAGVKNIISRVTDGQASTIDGVFRSTIPGANVFFLNPSGIIFGENASLDVQGSFHASTADYLKFKDGVKFETGLATANPILTTASPEAFGFLDNTPANISVSGGLNKVLEVPDGATLSLVGGDINIDNRSLYAPSGQVMIASAGSAGEVVFNESGVDTSSFTQGGKIYLSRDSSNPVPIINETMQIADIDVSADSAGKVVIRGGQMVMDNAYIWADTTNGNGGDIAIDLKGDLLINGVPESPSVEKTPQSGITANSQGSGNAGNIQLNVADLQLTHGTRIDSTSLSSGNSGDLLINANSIILDGNGSNAVPRLITGTQGSGDAGNINASTTGKLDVKGGGYIRSYSTAKGNAGDITLNAGSLGVHDQAQINIKVTQSAEGNGGNLTIKAKDAIDVSNGGLIDNSTDGKGHAGNIALTTDNLKVDNAIINSSLSGSGDGGDLNINTNNFTATNVAIVRSMVNESGTGKSGDINIVASGTVSLAGQNITIESFTGGQGDSGHICLISDKLDIRNGASIRSTLTDRGNTGSLFIDSNNIILTNDNTTWIDQPAELFGTTIKSEIIDFKENGRATGHSGNITVLAKQLTVSNGANIAAKNFGQGQSGDVNVESNNIHLTSDIDVGIYTSFISNDGESTGGMGNLTITSHNNLRLDNGGRIMTENLGTGSSGDLVVNANNIVLIGYEDKQKTGILNNKYPSSTKKPGTLTVNSDNLTIKNGAQIAGITFGSADAGNIVINSKQIDISSDGDKLTGITTQTQGTGNAADISIKTNHMVLSGEKAFLSASVEVSDINIQNSGAAGNILIEGVADSSDEHGMINTTKAKHITISNGASIATLSASSSSSSNTSGNITINTDLLELYNDSKLLSATGGLANSGNILINANYIALNDSRIFASTHASGNAGIIEIKTDTLNMHNDSYLLTGVSDIATGNGGDINITVKDFNLNASSLHAGIEPSSIVNSTIDRAGNIVINSTGTINLENKSFFSTFAPKESAGNITINGGNLLRLNGDSKILTLVESGSGTGGDIVINTPIVALDDSFITSRADKGKGGDITMTGHLFLSPLSAITASSNKSADGELKLKPVTNISGNLAVLPGSSLKASDHLSDRCGNLSENNKNSFVIKSRGGVPLSPGKLMPSTLMDITTPVDQQVRNTNNANKQANSFVPTNPNAFLASKQPVDCKL